MTATATDQTFEVMFTEGVNLGPSVAEQLKTIQQASAILKQDSNLYALLVAHSSTDGRADANQRTSQLRAEVVKKLLVQQGVAAARIVVTAVGSADLAVPETATDAKTLSAQRRRNRRVEVILKLLPPDSDLPPITPYDPRVWGLPGPSGNWMLAPQPLVPPNSRVPLPIPPGAPPVGMPPDLWDPNFIPKPNAGKAYQDWKDKVTAWCEANGFDPGNVLQGLTADPSDAVKPPTPGDDDSPSWVQKKWDF